MGSLVLALSTFVSSGCQAVATRELDKAARHKDALTKARSDIEQFRKSEFNIRVVDIDGRPVSGAELEIKQISHLFKFGCYLKIDDLDPAKLPAYERDFKNLFNYAVIGSYWDFIESSRGSENWSWFDRETALAGKMGIDVAAAPILWGTSKYGTPEWLPTKSHELWPTLEHRVKTAIKRGPAKADWEVVNEPLAPKTDVFSRTLSDEYISRAFAWAKETAPGKRTIINEYGIFGSVSEHNYNRERYFRLLQNLIARDVPIDIVGIQAHANGEWYGPADVAEELEKYSRLGRPVQITEFSVQTANNEDQTSPMRISGNYQSGLWNNDKQAEFYREFYTIAFANPQVEAIVTWGLDDERAWLAGVGLIDRIGERKPAYRQLDDLINREWKTGLMGTTGKDGRFTSRGFHGKYEVIAKSSKHRSTRQTFDLSRSNAGAWIVRLKS